MSKHPPIFSNILWYIRKIKLSIYPWKLIFSSLVLVKHLVLGKVIERGLSFFFSLSTITNARMMDLWVVKEGTRHWNHCFWRPFYDWKIKLVVYFWSALSRHALQEEWKDKLVWRNGKEECFLVKFFFWVILIFQKCASIFCKKSVRVNCLFEGFFLCFRSYWEKILTFDHLVRLIGVT